MADPTLKIRVTGDLDSIKAQLKALGADGTRVGDVLRQAGTSATQGFTSAERAAQSLTAQLNKGAAAARAQREAAREARRVSVQQEQDARRAARTQERLLRQQRALETKAAQEREREAAKKLRDEQRAADAVRRQANYRAAAVAPQITDIAVQLGSGSNPLLVLLQQGGQLRDIFGGVGQAIAGTARAIIGLISPVGLAVAAVAAVGAAFLKGQGEGLRFNRVLISTGNSAGKTAEELQAMARQLSTLDGSTVGSAAATIADVVESGKFAVGQIEAVSRAAEQMRNATGRDVAETVAEFARIADKPTETVDELNRKYGFLTGTMREQIRILEEQGRTQEAATLAVNAYAAAIDQRAPKIRENLGYIQRGWNAIKEATRSAADAALEIGRPQTGRQQFDALFAEQQRIQEELRKGAITRTSGTVITGMTELTPEMRRAREQRIAQIRQEMQALTDAEVEAQKQATKDTARKRAVALQGELSDEAKQLEDAGQRRARIRISVISRTNEAVKAAEIAGDEAAAKAAKESRDRIIAVLDKQDAEEAATKAEKAKRKQAEAAKLTAGLVATNAALVEDSVKRSLVELDALYEQGKISVRDYFDEKTRLELEAIDAAIRSAEVQRDLAQDADDRAKAEADITKLQRDRAAVGVIAAREQEKAERELVRTLDEIKARVGAATGDRLALQMLQIDRERQELQKKFANDPEALAWINRLFDVETAQARLDDIQSRASEAVRKMQQIEQTSAARVEAGADPAAASQDQRAAREEALLQLQRIRAELQALPADTKGAEEAIASLDASIGSITASNLTGFQRAIANLRAQLQQLEENFASNALGTLEDSITGFFDNLISGSMKAGDALRQLVLSFVQGLARMAAEALAKRFILSMFGSTAGVGVNHSGGLAGQGTRRMIPAGMAAAMFAVAPRYHQGGIAGLAPNEVPAILQRGEEVLPKNDPRHVANGGGQQQMPGTRVVNVFDASFVPDQMDSAAGEKVILNVIGRNPGVVRQLLE